MNLSPETDQAVIDRYHFEKDKIIYYLVEDKATLRYVTDLCKKNHFTYFRCNDALCEVVTSKSGIYYSLIGSGYFSLLIRDLKKSKINWAQDGF